MRTITTTAAMANARFTARIYSSRMSNQGARHLLSEGSPLEDVAPARRAFFRLGRKHLEGADAHKVGEQLHNISSVSDRGARVDFAEGFVCVEFPLMPPEFMHRIRVRVENLGSEQLREVVGQETSKYSGRHSRLKVRNAFR